MGTLTAPPHLPHPTPIRHCGSRSAMASVPTQPTHSAPSLSQRGVAGWSGQGVPGSLYANRPPVPTGVTGQGPAAWRAAWPRVARPSPDFPRARGAGPRPRPCISPRSCLIRNGTERNSVSSPDWIGSNWSRGRLAWSTPNCCVRPGGTATVCTAVHSSAHQGSGRRPGYRRG